MNCVINILKYLFCGFWWLYSLLFVYDIFLHYLLTISNYSEEWNKVLPGLGDTLANAIVIGLHFVCGIIILLFGQIQLLTAQKYGTVHKFMGRIYIVCSIVTSFCGMVFILYNGTVGGIIMSISFFMYGFLMFTFSLITFYYAYKRMIIQHREWVDTSILISLYSFIFLYMQYV